jgi:DNA gyrase subunit A
MLRHYVDHQVDVITRKTKFDLEKAKEREHILQGLKIAQRNIDEIIKTIKASKDNEMAQTQLMSLYQLSERQAKAVLEMRLRQLVAMEQDKIELEITELNRLINEYNEILSNPDVLMNVIKVDLKDIKTRYADARRTSFSNDSSLIEDEELIPVEDIIITLTSNGYIKRLNSDTYRTQNRGGRGIKGITTNEDDVVDNILVTSTHTDILFFTNYGKVYRLRGHQIPEYTRQGKGLPVINLLQTEKDEKVRAMISVAEYKDENTLIFITNNGVVKRVSVKEFENIRQNGKIAVTLRDGDQLFDVKLTTGAEEIYIASSLGKVVRFNEQDVRVMGRSAAGVNGINTNGGMVVGATTSAEGKFILAITKKGYGKMSEREEYRLTSRGGKGVITVNVTDKNGVLVAMRAVNGDEDLLVTTNKGTIIRLPLTQVKVAGRNTQGVRLIRLDEDQEVSSVAAVPHIEEEAPIETNEQAG